MSLPYALIDLVEKNTRAARVSISGPKRQSLGAVMGGCRPG